MVRPVTVEVSDGSATARQTFRVVLTDPALLAHAGITRQFWGGISGVNVADLSADHRYPSRPDSSQTLASAAAPVNAADNYGQRLAGYLRAPQSGAYTFWIASDDSSELRLGSTSDPASLSAAPLASVSGYTGANQWTKYPSQKSAPVNLVKGQVYSLQALHKEGGGADHLDDGPLRRSRLARCRLPYHGEQHREPYGVVSSRI